MIVTTAAFAARVRADILLVPVVAGLDSVPEGLGDLDQALDGGLATLLSADPLGLGGTAETLTLGRLAAKRLAVVGMGDAGDLDSARLRNGLELALRRLRVRSGSATVAWNHAALPGVDRAEMAEAAVEAAVLSGFTEATHRSGRRAPLGVERLTLAGFGRLEKRRLTRAIVMGEAALRARELVNAPASELSPAAFVAAARRVASTALRVDVLDQKELRRRGYGAILAVGAGSAAPPCMVVMRYLPPGRPVPGAPKRLLALVGKGITFDSGGISIKPSADMQFMKGDMGGAAAVMCAMSAIERLRPAVEVVGILCLAENMVSSRSMRPGDVVRSGNGLTIDVVNTDAEGRMVLADGIHHAVKLGATAIVDIATLTGGQRVALGPVAAAVQSDDDLLAAEVFAAADAAGERIWAMPSFHEYESLLESPIADLTNSPGPNASAITAGLFLRRFAAGRPWLHIDMAAPSWNRVSGLREIPSGPTGFGVRTLIRLALGRAKSDKFSRK
jgi:leucyl aminopeptidase